MITLSVPDWLRTFLGWFNFSIRIPPWNWSIFGMQVLTAGDWLNINLSIGSWILYAIEVTFSVINGSTNFLWDLGNAALRKAWDAFNLALELGAKIIQNVYQTIQNVYQTVTQTIQNVYQTISNVVNNVYQTFTSVYQTVNNYVVGVTEDFVQRAIAGVMSPLAPIVNLVSVFAQDIGGFFSNPIDWFFGRLDAWLNEEVE